jgi:hypothetical protein
MKTKISPQLAHYRKNKTECNKRSMGYRKRLLAIGRYAIQKKLLTEKELEVFDKFIFRKRKIPLDKQK